jgi:hypothetical protein
MSTRTVTFQWDDSIGDCFDCGRPVAMQVIDAYGPGRHEDVCSVCAANYAVDGATIAWHPDNPNYRRDDD